MLIGGLGLGIVLLPWLREFTDKAPRVDAALGLAGGAVALGLAFWLGIPLDRLADTLTERLDQHARLRFALTRVKGWPVPAVSDGGGLDHDLYPADRLRVSALRDTDAVAGWIDYHRSRIRLTRALAVYGPALTVMLALGLDRLYAAAVPPVSAAWLGGLLAAYALWALVGVAGPTLPRTDHGEAIAHAMRWKLVDAQRFVKPSSGAAWVWLAEWRTLVGPAALLALALLLAALSAEARVGAAVSAAAALTALSAWSWWRIGFTYRTYLAQLDRFRAPA